MALAERIAEVLQAGALSLGELHEISGAPVGALQGELALLLHRGAVVATKDGERRVYHLPDGPAAPAPRPAPKPPRRAALYGAPDPSPAPRRRVRDDRESRKEPLEWLAMLAGRSNYLTPTEGRSTAAPPVTALDVAHAIARAPDRLGAAAGLAMACQRASEWETVHELGYPRLCHALERQRAQPGVIAGGLRFRARIVLYDAFQHLLAPTRRPPLRVAAAESGIREDAYRFIHRHATSLLQASAATAASQACQFLFSPFGLEAPGTGPVLVLADEHGHTTAIPAVSHQALIADLRDRHFVDWLLQELAANPRPRTLGVLTLGGVQHVGVLVDRKGGGHGEYA